MRANVANTADTALTQVEAKQGDLIILADAIKSAAERPLNMDIISEISAGMMEIQTILASIIDLLSPTSPKVGGT